MNPLPSNITLHVLILIANISFMRTNLLFIARLLWLSSAVGGLLLTFWLGPGLMYAKLQSDSATYLLQAKMLWENGISWNFSLAQGLPQIIYTPVPAFLRAPLFAFDFTPTQLPLVLQLQNLTLLAMLAWVSQQYLAIRLPNSASKKWVSVPWIMIALSYQPWVLNTFMPLGDHLFALMSMASIMFYLKADHAAKIKTAKLLAYCGYLITAIAVIQKSTALGLFVYAILVFGRKSHSLRRSLVPGGLIILMSLVYFSQLHSYVLSIGTGNYLANRTLQAIFADTITNLVFSALPNQIIPNFSYLLTRDAYTTNAYQTSSISINDIPWMALGLAISGAIVFGGWIARYRLLPELALLLVTIPLYALVTNSTARYLASVQPIFWIFLIYTFSHFSGFFIKYRYVIVVMITCVLIITLPQLATNITRSFTSISNPSIRLMPNFLRELAITFNNGKNELAVIIREKPNSQILLINEDFRWAALIGANYLSVDLARKAVCNGASVITVFACDARNCSRQKVAHDYATKNLENYGMKPELITNFENQASVFRIEHWHSSLSTCHSDN
jgi:hypothetical protein